MNKFTLLSLVKLETFAVDIADLNTEIAHAENSTECTSISASFSIAIGHRPGGDPVILST